MVLEVFSKTSNLNDSLILCSVTAFPDTFLALYSAFPSGVQFHKEDDGSTDMTTDGV